jgi:hypothetical protein
MQQAGLILPIPNKQFNDLFRSFQHRHFEFESRER